MKVPSEDKCRDHDGFVRKGWSDHGLYILVLKKTKCCVCEKEMVVEIKDFDLQRARRYQTYGGQYKNFGYRSGGRAF